MDFKVEIKNFGKLEDVTVDIKQLTILAGKNNTGKSFISKSLYSFFNTMNIDYIYTDISSRVFAVYDNFQILESSLSYVSQSDKKFLKFALHSINELKDNIVYFQSLTIQKQIEKAKQYQLTVDSLVLRAQEFTASMQEKKRKYQANQQYLEDLLSYLKVLQHGLFESNMLGTLAVFLEARLENNLLRCFQVADKNTLILVADKKKQVCSFDIQNIGTIRLDKKEMDFSFNVEGLDKLQSFSNVIYLESPIYWKLKSALQLLDSNSSSFFNNRNKNEFLTGVPSYFYDLASLLSLKSTKPPIFQETLDLIQSTIGGNLELSMTGELIFNEKDKGSYPLSTVALGVSNLGILAMLLEKNLIDTGTFLFIDEPEAHLHPAWQIVMIEALYNLAKEGVHVVVATHSIEILKYIEVIAKKDEQAQSLIALNHIPEDGKTKQDGLDFYDKLSEIKQDLTEPFFDLYMEGLFDD